MSRDIEDVVNAANNPKISIAIAPCSVSSQVAPVVTGVDGGVRPGTTTEESDELKRLRRENAELKRANDILKAASAFFAAEIDRPPRRS